MNSIERSGWDLKFQNYWGYTIAAEGNEKMAQALCTRLFAHIGLFRDEATRHFQQIVDSLHLPDSELKPEKYNEDTIQDAGVFDEHDNRLYTGEERSQGSTLNKLNFNMVEHNVFLHNNIYYKVTNLNEQLSMCRVKASDPSPRNRRDACEGSDDGRGVRRDDGSRVRLASFRGHDKFARLRRVAPLKTVPCTRAALAKARAPVFAA